MSTNSLDRGIKRRTLLKAGLALGALQFAAPGVSGAAAAEKKYGPGATDSQIRIATHCQPAGVLPKTNQKPAR